MKTPAEYLADAKEQLPSAEPATQALVAIAQALADAEKYRAFLLRALRRGTSSTPMADVATSTHEMSRL